MIRYILKRFLLMIPVLLGVAILIFTIMYFVPGDPAEIILGTGALPEEIALKTEQLGLDDPYIVQLGRFLYNTFIKFDLGKSYLTDVPVVNELKTRFPRTFFFSLACMVIRLVFGTLLGVTAAVHQNSFGDRASTLLALVGVSIPNFWLALMLVVWLSVNLHLLPAFGIGSAAHYVLPVISGSIGGIAIQTRQTRSSMLEVIRADFVTTARSKGVSERRILLRHILPNGLIPVIQVAGEGFGLSLAGSLIIENVFSIPGIGMYLNTAVSKRDYPIVRGSVVLLALVFSLIMLLVDIAFAFVDPRIKAQYENSGGLFKKKIKKEASENG